MHRCEFLPFVTAITQVGLPLGGRIELNTQLEGLVILDKGLLYLGPSQWLQLPDIGSG